MSSRDCRSRNSLLSRLRGSFSFSLKRISCPAGGSVVVLEANVNRIYARITDASTGGPFAFRISGTTGDENRMTILGTVSELIEWSIDYAPGLVQCCLVAESLGGGYIVNVEEVFAN